jgi:GNAT superfamily N-acetyltransferase
MIRLLREPFLLSDLLGLVWKLEKLFLHFGVNLYASLLISLFAALKLVKISPARTGCNQIRPQQPSRKIIMKKNLSITIKRLSGREDSLKSFCCMTEVGAPWPEALCLCRDWIAANLGKYVEGFHLELADGTAAGHIYYGILPEALISYEVKTKGAGVLYCEWVQRRFQGKGLGKQLFDAFMSQMKENGVPGVLVEATDQKSQMYYGDYLSRGFHEVHSSKNKRLLYLPITQPAIEVQPLEPCVFGRSGLPVEIVVLFGYLCPYDVSAHLLLRDIAREFGDQVTLQEVWLTPETVQDFGETRGIFINGRQKLWGGEPEGAIRQAIVDEIENGR